MIHYVFTLLTLKALLHYVGRPGYGHAPVSVVKDVDVCQSILLHISPHDTDMLQSLWSRMLTSVSPFFFISLLMVRTCSSLCGQGY